MHLGDFDAAAVIYGKFATYRPSTGATFALGGSAALSVYKDNSTTQSTTGVTLTVDFDAVTGLNHFAIDTSADGTFYAAGSFFDIVITTGTVDSVSVTGSVVGSFTLRKTSAIKPTVAARTLDVTATGAAGVDWGNVENPTTALNLSGTNIDVDQVVASVSGAVGSVTGAVGSVTGAVGSVTGNVGGNVVGSVASVTARVTANTDQLAGQTVTAGAGVTFPASVASPTNITAGVITTVTNLTNAPTVGDLTAAMKASVNTETDTALTDYDGPTNAELATALGTADDAVLAQIALVKTKTDFLPSATAGAAGGVFIAGTNAATTITTGLTTTFTGNLTGSVGSVTGAVGSVTGNVGGNVVGSVASVTADVGITQGGADKAWNTATRELTAGTNIVLAKGTGITGFNDLSAAQVNAEADTALADVGVTTTVTGRIDVAISTRLATAGYTAPANASIATILGVTNKLDPMLEDDGDSPSGGYRYTAEALELAPTGGSAPSAAVIADAVWDELLAGHAVGGSAGAALSAAGTAGDPWLTALPGAYGAGTAGKIVGDNINATISSRATQTSVDTVDGIVDSILVDTAEIGAAGSGLTALGDARIANLDATISSRTKPADTQAAVTTVTNLTNAPTAGDFTAVMKTSLNAATPASVIGAVGSVTGGVTVTTNNDKTGYRLSTTGVDDVWDEAIAGHLTAGTTGKALNDATSAGNPWNSVLEGTLTAGDLLRIQAGVAVGKSTIVAPGNGTAHVEFRDASDLSLIVAADLTGSERTAVALTP